MIDILEEVTTKTKIGFSRMNLKKGLNTPWKDSVEKSAKNNSSNIRYKSEDKIIKCHNLQCTKEFSDTCPKRGKINEIDLEKEPDVAKDDIKGENSDDKSSIFYESSKHIENINVTYEVMEYYSPLPQLRISQPDLSKYKMHSL
ncbi:hypothetical protein O181_014943 [Austropuccinia psidii MF-1]|uniref:Uncharacterized protein n=1 Tax=Austropuccinia psidii MF-1 TaxID=1389203 RepID=A0A9Q3C271_9BASI|nr:hypothetical protein [Austropuccinia psidii MF-1]